MVRQCLVSSDLKAIFNQNIFYPCRALSLYVYRVYVYTAVYNTWYIYLQSCIAVYILCVWHGICTTNNQQLPRLTVHEAKNLCIGPPRLAPRVLEKLLRQSSRVAAPLLETLHGRVRWRLLSMCAVVPTKYYHRQVLPRLLCRTLLR